MNVNDDFSALASPFFIPKLFFQDLSFISPAAPESFHQSSFPRIILEAFFVRN